MGVFMKKETFFKATLILILGGAITKALGMFIKIVMTRIVGIEGISLYMLIFPTFALFMTISQLGFPVAISKLVAEERYNNKKLIFSIIPFSLLFNILLMLIIIFIAPILANNLLKEPKALYPILAIGLVLPFDSLSSILRGFFFGKQRMFPHIISLVTEQIVRLILIVTITPTLLEKNIIYATTSLVLVNLFSELSSIIILLFFIPNKKNIKKEEIKPDITNIKNILSIALPTTGARLIGSICYFFEPIILTQALTLAGYSSSYIITEYGIIEGYVLPLLMLPNFFTNALSSALVPVVSKSYVTNNKKEIKRKLKQVTTISLLIGIPLTIILMINPEFFLKNIYKTTHGGSYLKFIAPFFIILYIQSPLASILQAINKAKNIMIDNLIGTIIKIILIFICSLLKIGLYGFLISLIANIIIVTILHFKTIKKEIIKDF